jgi:hypothetical protein
MDEILERHRVYGLYRLEAWKKTLNEASDPHVRPSEGAVSSDKVSNGSIVEVQMFHTDVGG